MSIIEFLSQPIWQQLGLTLMHFLWQGLAVAILVGVFIKVFKLNHGNVRYVAYLLAFVAIIACLVATFITIDISVSPDIRLGSEIELTEPVENVSDTHLPVDDTLLNSFSFESFLSFLY